MPMRELVVALMVFALYWLAAQLGFVFSYHGILTPVWPPAAVGAAAAILYGPRSLWLAAVYVFVDLANGNFLDSQYIQRAWIEPVGLVASACIVSMVAKRSTFDCRLSTVRQIGLLIGIAVAYASVNGAVLATGYCAVLHVPSCIKSGSVFYWWQSFIGDFFGCLIVMPALLSWARQLDPLKRAPQSDPVDSTPDDWRLDPSHWRFVAAGCLCVAMGWWGTHEIQLPVSAVGFLVLPLLVWAALQFRPLFVHTTIMATGLTAISLQLTSGGVTFLDPKVELTSLLLFLLSASVLTLIVNVIVQQQQSMARALVFRSEQARIELMLQAATDAVLSFDDRGHVTYCNPAADRALRPDSSPLLDTAVADILPSRRFAHLERDGMAVVMAADPELFSGKLFELELPGQSDKLRVLEVTLTAYRTNRDWNATAFIRDVTQRKQAETELRLALERQRELNDLRSRFVSMTSHEFRTPMSTILSSSELLNYYGDRLPATEKKHVHRNIQTAVERMAYMLDRVLLLGKAEAHMLEFNPQEVNLANLCNDIVEQAKTQQSESKCQLLLEFSAREATGQYDEKLLRHIFSNLLSNALKYSPEGGVVRMTVCSQGGQTILQVSDQGIGIPPDELKHLFESFYRASNVGLIAGTGLGLAIVKQCVDLHQGTIEVTSQLNQGTNITVRLRQPSMSQNAAGISESQKTVGEAP